MVSSGSDTEGIKILQKNGSGTEFQAIYKTTDEAYAKQLEMANSQVGYLVAGNGPDKLYKTINGGKNWQLVWQADWYILDLCVLDEKNLFLMYSSTIYRSQDGGLTWSVSIPQNFTSTPNDIYFLNENIGFVTHSKNGLIKKTTDGGLTWQELYLPVTDPNYADITDIYFTDQSKGFATASRNDVLFHTDDGGRTWNNMATNYLFGSSKLFFYPDGRGLIYTDNQWIYYTRDFGKTMKLFLNTNPGFIRRITAINDTTLILPHSLAVYKITFPKK